jgi:DNA-binding CsgD family transcriptional regulator
LRPPSHAPRPVPSPRSHGAEGAVDPDRWDALAEGESLDPGRPPGALATLGLDVVEDRIVWLLARSGSVPAREVGDILGLPPAPVTAALARLVNADLVAVDSGGSAALLPPEVALGSVLAAEQNRLAQARLALTELVHVHQTTRARLGAHQLVEIVEGRSGIRRRLQALQENAQFEVEWLCKAGHVAMPSSENLEEFAALERGVSYRVVYEADLLAECGMLDSVRLGMKAGEQARATSEVPVRMAIFDRSVALCPLVVDGAEGSFPTAALIRDSLLVTAMHALFEHVWRTSVPLHPDDGITPGGDADHPGQGAASPLSGADRHVLALMVAGTPDKAIASQLGVSIRTVRRRIAVMMEAADCHSRVQLAWLAAQNHWL